MVPLVCPPPLTKPWWICIVIQRIGVQLRQSGRQFAVHDSTLPARYIALSIPYFAPPGPLPLR